MDLQEINQGLENITRSVNKVYTDWAKAKSDYENLDNQKKTILAFYELKYCDLKTQTEINRAALNDPGFKEWIIGLNLATRKYNRSTALKMALETKLSCYQSASKNYLAENNITKNI